MHISLKSKPNNQPKAFFSSSELLFCKSDHFLTKSNYIEMFLNIYLIKNMFFENTQ